MCKTALFLLLASACAFAQMDVSKLKLPPGFHISIFADTEAEPRMMAWSPGGVLLATITDDGLVIAVPDPDHKGSAERIVKVLTNLNGRTGSRFTTASCTSLRSLRWCATTGTNRVCARPTRR
jgi:hypothetical protein